MTKKEYNNLKYGDVVTHCSYGGYYIVHGIFDNEWIDCQALGDIGKETDLGYEHTNWKYEYCTKLTNKKLLDAIHFIIQDETIVNRDEFVYGVEWYLNNYEKSHDNNSKMGIDKACEWLRYNMNIHQTSFALTNPPEPGQFINAEEAFRKAMEGNKK